MGRFFSAIHIHNSKTAKAFQKEFEKSMKQRGYVKCTDDDAECTYTLAFSDNWVTVTAENYESNPHAPKSDAGFFANEMKTCCFAVTVVDSDFAILELFDNSDKLCDTMIVGNGSGYGFDEPERGRREYWEKLLKTGRSWDDLCMLAEANETFVEDTLCGISDVFGIVPDNMVGEYDDFIDSEDEHVVALNFRKKVEKKLTLNAAFKQIFGEALEPLGFVQLKKTKLPVYIRVVNDEILHIITYRNISAMKTGYKRFKVLGGVVSIYRRTIEFNESLETLLFSNFRYYHEYDVSVSDELMQRIVQFNCDIWGKPIEWYHEPKEIKDEFIKQIIDFQCRTDNADEMLKGVKNAFDVTNEIMLPQLDKVTNLTSCIDFFYENDSHSLNLCEIEDFIKSDNFSYSESLLLILANYRDDGKERTKTDIEQHLSSLNEEITPKLVEKISLLHESKRAEQVAIRDRILDTPELKKIALNEADRCKTKNIEIFKSYGLDFTQTSTQKAEKKLTLNAAFKQIFGEALEPLGFVKIKNKHPYYARLIGDGILHVITVVPRPDKRFEILGGIATVYRQSLSLELNPKMNESWMKGNFYYYGNMEIFDNERKYSLNEIYEFYDDDQLENEMKRALNATKDIMLNIFDNIVSLEKCAEFYNIFGMDIRIHHKEDFGNSYPINYYNEGLLIIKTMNLEQYSSLMDKYNEITINRRKKQITNGGVPYERLINEQEVFKNKKVSEYKDLLNNKEWLATADIELERRKKENISKLRSYGLNIQ